MPRMMTDALIRALQPGRGRYALRDAKVSGLELRVHPDGTKVWSLRYRINGQQRRLKLGEYSPTRMTLADARARANAELRKVDGGIDPQAERQAAARAVAQAKHLAEEAKRDSIEALAESYLERHAKPHKRTWRDDRSMLTTEILPAWRGRAVSSITRRDCRELLQGMADRGAPVYADRVGALLSRMFRFAVDHEIITSNPAQHLPKCAPRANGEREQKAYEADEIRAIWQATEPLDAGRRAIYRLGLITGQRPGEITGMAWAEISGNWWTIPGRRTKNGRDHRVYLTQAALDELARVPRLEGEPRVFRGYLGVRQQSACNAIVFAGVRRREKPRHALRDTVATGLAAAGVPVEHISRVLNHSVGLRVTAGYNAYAYDKEKRTALLRWERRLTAILESKADQTVVSIAAGAAG